MSVWYTASSATGAAVPHEPQTATAVVISVPNTSISSPPIALPSSPLESAGSSTGITRLPCSRRTARAEPLGPHPRRRVAERDQAGRHRLHEVRRAAHEGQRPLLGRPRHLGQHG